MVAKTITQDDEKQQAQSTPAAKPHRTIGLRLFDIGLYPLLTNFGVFVVSVAATYLTSHGADRGKDGKLIFGKLGEIIKKRGDWLMGVFKNWGMSPKQADMAKMVTFSFVDGSAMAPLVKVLEDKREVIAHKIDEKLGTAPESMDVYKAEPKQSWKSVWLGRISTFAIVLPTAIALDKIKFKDGFNLNDKLFKHPGEWLGNKIAKRPKLAKHFGPLHIPALFGIGFFEAFYTSVCTAGLYVSSRFFASMGGKKKEKSEAPTDMSLAEKSQATPELKGSAESNTMNHAARETARQQTAAAALTSLML